MCECVCVCVCVSERESEWVSLPLTPPLLPYLSLSLYEGKRGQQPHAQGQGSTNGMLRMGRVGGVCDPTITSLRACFRESIVCVSRPS